MNFNLYIFRRKNGTYNQYPDDYTSSILGSFCADVSSSKAMIMRDQNLMHYVYATSIGQDVIGICLIFNKAYIKHVSKIFTFLRTLIVSTLPKQDKIIRYNDKGFIEFTTNDLSDDVESYDYIKTLVNSKLDSRNNYFGVSELVTAYTGLHNSVNVGIDAANSEILKLQLKFNTIVIDDYRVGIEEDSTKKVITGLQRQIAELNVIIDGNNQKISRLEKAKKQYKKVVFLVIVLLCSCVGLYSLYSTLNKTEQSLQDATGHLKTANDSIKFLNNTIVQKQNTINTLNTELGEERRLKESAQRTLENIQSNCPFIITGTSCRLSSDEYTVRYFSSESTSCTIKIKVFEEKSGRLYTEKSVTEYLNSGTGSFTVYFNRSFNSSDWYTFEIWNGSRIIGGSRH